MEWKNRRTDFAWAVLLVFLSSWFGLNGRQTGGVPTGEAIRFFAQVWSDSIPADLMFFGGTYALAVVFMGRVRAAPRPWTVAGWAVPASFAAHWLVYALSFLLLTTKVRTHEVEPFMWVLTWGVVGLLGCAAFPLVMAAATDRARRMPTVAEDGKPGPPPSVLSLPDRLPVLGGSSAWASFLWAIPFAFAIEIIGFVHAALEGYLDLWLNAWQDPIDVLFPWLLARYAVALVALAVMRSRPPSYVGLALYPLTVAFGLFYLDVLLIYARLGFWVSFTNFDFGWLVLRLAADAGLTLFAARSIARAVRWREANAAGQATS